MPVATTVWWPRTRSSMPKMRLTSSMPSSAARLISVRLIGHSWPWISPPRQRRAAAAMMPSGAPPMPIARWSFVPRMAALIEAMMSPSAISLIRAPASRISATRSSWRVRSSTIAVTSATRRPNASAIASRFSRTGRRRSIRPFATGPTAILRMYIRGTCIRPPGSLAARIESAPGRPPATAVPFPTGSHARSSRCPPEPSSEPSRRAWPSSPRPITSAPEIGTASSASRMATEAASSAISGSPRPSRRPAASALRSVTAARSVHGQRAATPGSPASASGWTSGSVDAMASGYRGGASGGALEDQVHHREERLGGIGRLDHRPPLLLGPRHQILLDAADLAEPLQVALHRPQPTRVGAAGEEVRLVHLLVRHRQHHLHDDGARVLVGGDEARHDVDPFDDGREALEDGPLDDGVRPHRHLARLLDEPVQRPVLVVRVGQWDLEALGGVEGRVVQLGHELLGEERPHRLADDVGRRDPADPKPVGDLGRDGALPRARGAADQQHQRPV